ncbi:MAG: ribonuclease III [Candidatus Schekmanbacteria bacterium RBG_13_48_7]|uniref:Ribonuclease 3 n=1 Tax=Candidatus Schekmanbacteria bacterium RBG_13_48_7 TaxID=1817878 RepID=A0A1F7RWB6_9BACT|nr:MAG: ribonuclease III [Candidatus Schekmanbacteria bacterium RBG_13_48_7]
MGKKTNNSGKNLSGTRQKKIKHLEKYLNYKFKNLNLLKQALTHSSYANEKTGKNLGNNEKLEFLGDSVLELVISEYLIECYPESLEGVLTKLRAELVNATSLYQKSLELGLGSYLLLGKGEEQSKGREKMSILSDALEAVMGSIFLDSGYRGSRRIIRKLFKNDIEKVTMPESISDFKTLLQEKTQKLYGSTPTYRLLSSDGPDHNRTFHVSVIVKKEVLGTGTGKTKKDAEQMAAKEAAQKISQLNE